MSISFEISLGLASAGTVQIGRAPSWGKPMVVDQAVRKVLAFGGTVMAAAGMVMMK
jgi:hypothetical protein